MSFKQETEKLKQHLESTLNLKNKIKEVAETNGIEIDLGQDTMEDVLGKIDNNFERTIWTQKQDGSFSIKIIKKGE